MITINGININIDSGYLWLVLFIFLLIFIVIGIVLRYHWEKYLIDFNLKDKVSIIFWFGSIFLILLAIFSLILFIL